MSDQDGVREATAKEPESPTDIVRRALAILDEEVRAWLGPHPTPPTRAGDP